MMTSRPSRPASRSGSLGERVQPVGIDDERHRRAIDERRMNSRVAGGLAEARAERDDVARQVEHPIDAVGIEAVVGLVERLGHVLRRHRRDDRLAASPASRRSRGRRPTAARRPRPDAPRRSCRAIRRRRARGRSRPCGCRRRAARSARASPRASAARRAGRRAPRCTSAGMPMSAMTMSPARVSAGGSTSGSFGAPSVTVSAGFDRLADRLRRVGRQARRQIDRHDRDARRVDVGDDRSRCSPDSGAFRPVPKIASTMSVQSLTSEKCSSHAWLSAISTTVRPRRPRISRLMRASPRTSATRPMRNTETSTPRCISVRATTKPSPPLLPRPQSTATWRSSRSPCIASIAATTWRPAFSISTSDGNADLLDRPAIGFAHLRGVQDAHAADRRATHRHKDTKARSDTDQGDAALHRDRLCCAGSHSGLMVRSPSWQRRSTSTAASPIRSTPSSRSSITGSCTARASTRRCAPTTASRFSSIGTCGACATSAGMLALAVPLTDDEIDARFRETMRAAGLGDGPAARRTSGSSSRAASAS